MTRRSYHVLGFIANDELKNWLELMATVKNMTISEYVAYLLEDVKSASVARHLVRTRDQESKRPS